MRSHRGHDDRRQGKRRHRQHRRRAVEGDVAAAPGISLRGAVKTYELPAGEVTAVAGVDLEVHQGEFVAIIGKSGCGKSTGVRSADPRSWDRSEWAIGSRLHERSVVVGVI